MPQDQPPARFVTRAAVIWLVVAVTVFLFAALLRPERF